MDCKIKTSSWKDDKYGFLFYGLVRGLKPTLCVELGTYAGYSAHFIGKALRDNRNGALRCYDLWNDYDYNHVSIKEARKNLKGLPVELHQRDIKDVSDLYYSGSVDFLMVDFSNDGEKYRYILNSWYPKLKDSSIVVMEGGTRERDNVSWMKKYKKEKIQKALRGKEINEMYKFNTISDFPGVTILEKR